MAFEPHHDLGLEASSPIAPHLLHGPTEAPPPLHRVTDSTALQALRHELTLQRTRGGALWSGSIGRTARVWAGRLTGRSRWRLVAALAGATVELGDHCDRLTDRLMAQEDVMHDVASAFGEELARLRAEVVHLAGLVAALDEPHDA